MGHITTDLIEDAWRSLKSADHLAKNGQEYAAVMKCEDALEDLFRSADGVGEGVWFTKQEQDLREEISVLKRETEPVPEDVLDLVNETRRIVKECKEHLVPIINDRIDGHTDAQLTSF